jgi:hypothetical protein
MTALLTILVLQTSSFGQVTELPDTILITDEYYSPWGVSLKYNYRLELVKNKYRIKRTYQRENETEKKTTKIIGKISSDRIHEFIEFIQSDDTPNLQFANFSNEFYHEKASKYVQENGRNNWVTSEVQRNFIIDNLTKPEEVEKSLQSYYQYYDHSFFLDGSTTKLTLTFTFDNKEIEIVSNSILEYAFPISINGEDNYNPKLAAHLANIIPKSKTNRVDQLSGKNLFNEVAQQVITDNRDKLSRLEVLDYKDETDLLKKSFRLSNLRVVNGTASTNWNGEKRYNCQLWNKESDLNISIMYSSLIEDGSLQYSPSIVIDKYEELINTVLAIDFFRDFLSENSNRKISIIFDDNSSFTQKTRESVLRDYDGQIDFDNSLYLALWNENKDLSSWIIKTNGEYLLWNEISGKAITPNGDKFFSRINE